VCRPARPDGPAWERRLAEADQVAVAGAVERLSVADPALSALWSSPQAGPVVRIGGHGAAAFLDGLDVGALADDLLTVHHLAPGRVLVDGPDGTPLLAPLGSITDFSITRHRATEVLAALERPAAVTILAVEAHRRELTRRSFDLDVLTSASSRADVVLWGPHAIQARPADDAARLVLVVDGDLTVTSAVDLSGFPADGDGDVHPVGAGDAIVVPSGRDLRAVAGPDGALALVVVVPRRPLLDEIEQIVHQGVFWPQLRAVVPVDLDQPWSSYAPSPLDGDLAAALVPLAGPEDRAMITGRTRARLRPRFTAVPSACPPDRYREPDDDLLVRSTLPGGLVVHTGSTPAAATLLGGGVRILARPDVACALALLADHRPHRLSEIGNELGDDRALAIDLVQGLLRAGLIEVYPT
jgi:hypothetical protein